MYRSPLRAALLLGCVVLCTCGDGERVAPRRPNLLLISIDTLRADHLGCYGYERETSPALDALAADGVRFERCVSSSSWTLPAHLSMLTGLPVSAHGIDDDRQWSRVDAGGAPLPPDLRGRFVSETLAEAGYATAGFHTWKYLDDRFGFGPGFDVWERLGHTFWSHPDIAPEWERLRAEGDTEGLKALAAEHDALFRGEAMVTPEVVDRALGWLDGHLEREDGAPFFLFTHVFDVHDPYVQPEPYASRFDPDYSGPIDGHNVTSPGSPVRHDMAARDLANLVARYDGGIAYVDAQLTRLFDALRERDLLENTLIVVTSDHGEEFFEHGHKTHRRQLYAESIEVPLILHWPAGLPDPRVVPGTVGLIDLPATLCGAAGVAFDSGHAGRDLLPLARGEAQPGARAYLSELTLFDGQAAPERQLTLTAREARSMGWTRGTAPWRVRRWDLATDPSQGGPGAALEPPSTERADWQAAFDALRAGLTRLRDALPRREDSLPPLTDAERRELAAGGYSGGEETTGEARERLPIDGGVWSDG